MPQENRWGERQTYVERVGKREREREGGGCGRIDGSRDKDLYEQMDRYRQIHKDI